MHISPSVSWFCPFFKVCFDAIENVIPLGQKLVKKKITIVGTV